MSETNHHISCLEVDRAGIRLVLQDKGDSEHMVYDAREGVLCRDESSCTSRDCLWASSKERRNLVTRCLAALRLRAQCTLPCNAILSHKCRDPACASGDTLRLQRMPSLCEHIHVIAFWQTATATSIQAVMAYKKRLSDATACVQAC